MRDFIFLYGPPCVGKSSVGKLLASKLNLPFVDLDAEIARHANKPIPEIFSSEGEDGFRSWEQKILDEIIKDSSGVVALGGGALLNPRGRAKVELCGQVVFLDGSTDVLMERLDKCNPIRPLIAEGKADKLENLLSQRTDHYASFSRRCNTDKLTPNDVVWEIQKLIGWFHVEGMGEGYQVKVMNGGLGHLGRLISNVGVSGEVCIVLDENVSPLYAQTAIDSLLETNIKVHLYTIPPGESHKNLTTVLGIWGGFLRAKLDRGSTVIALGGGVVGDLTGFAAAAYMRGIDWVNVPTTLLAMVDASIGGKTGFNLPQGKNLIGAFHPPTYVLVDPEVLSTLPDHELRSGMAEVVKHGVIGSPSLFEQCARQWPDNPEDIEQLVKDAISVKMDVIQADPYEKGVRLALNLGHTIGHAVELLSGFKISHGDAVAIGMVAEARMAERLGITNNGFVEMLIDTLAELGLPTEIPLGMSKTEIIETIQIDKKIANGYIRFSMPESVGQVKTGVVVDQIDKILGQI